MWTKELRQALIYGTYSHIFWLEEMSAASEESELNTVIGGLEESGENIKDPEFDRGNYSLILHQILDKLDSTNSLLSGLTNEWLKTAILVKAIMIVFCKELDINKDKPGFNTKKQISLYIKIATTHIGESGSHLVHALCTKVVEQGAT